MSAPATWLLAASVVAGALTLVVVILAKALGGR